MKAIVVLVLIFSCFSISCSKTSFSISNSNITGKWKLVLASGGIAGSTTHPADNRIITFEPSGKYSSMVSDTIVSSGSYNITKVDKITYGMAIRNDSLFLDEGCCDRLSYLYVREK